MACEWLDGRRGRRSELETECRRRLNDPEEQHADVCVQPSLMLDGAGSGYSISVWLLYPYEADLAASTLGEVASCSVAAVPPLLAPLLSIAVKLHARVPCQ